MSRRHRYRNLTAILCLAFILFVAVGPAAGGHVCAILSEGLVLDVPVVTVSSLPAVPGVPTESSPGRTAPSRAPPLA